jgi:hypothetical protein
MSEPQTGRHDGRRRGGRLRRGGARHHSTAIGDRWTAFEGGHIVQRCFTGHRIPRRTGPHPRTGLHIVDMGCRRRLRRPVPSRLVDPVALEVPFRPERDDPARGSHRQVASRVAELPRHRLGGKLRLEIRCASANCTSSSGWLVSHCLWRCSHGSGVSQGGDDDGSYGEAESDQATAAFGA